MMKMDDPAGVYTKRQELEGRHKTMINGRKAPADAIY